MRSRSDDSTRQANSEPSSGAEDLSRGKRRNLLIALGAESLADSLLELCAYSSEAEQLVLRLISTPTENTHRFRRRIAELKKSTRYVDYSAAPTLAQELRFLLDEIECSVTDPTEGLDLVRRFLETDASIFERCDDSMGAVGDVYRTDVTQLFSVFAKDCEDKGLVAKMMIDMQRDNNYGARDGLVVTAFTCLPENIMRDMIDTFLELAGSGSDTCHNSDFFISAESLAKQLKDAECFESIRRAFRGELSTSSRVDIAEVYLDSGAVDIALRWLDEINPNEHFRLSDRDSLYEAAYRANGNTESLTMLLQGRFHDSPCERTLQALLDQVGEHERTTIIEEQVSRITQNSTLNTSNASFLLSIGAVGEAADYVVNRAEQLDGGVYIGTSDLAKNFTTVNCHLAASLLYRCLLVSILEQGRTKAYSHGVRYLKLLDRLATSITDWKSRPNHEQFKAELVDHHGRKRSFWSKYAVKSS